MRSHAGGQPENNIIIGTEGSTGESPQQAPTRPAGDKDSPASLLEEYQKAKREASESNLGAAGRFGSGIRPPDSWDVDHHQSWTDIYWVEEERKRRLAAEAQKGTIAKAAPYSTTTSSYQPTGKRQQLATTGQQLAEARRQA